MDFSDIINNFKDLLSVKENNIKNKNQNINDNNINKLNQGLKYLNNKKDKIDSLKKRISIIENFDRGDEILRNKHEQENNLLKNLETKYNRELIQYSKEYKIFMKKYMNGMSDVRSCKANCIQTYPKTMQNYANKRKACEIGCELKGPYTQQCSDTFLRSRSNGESCKSVTKGLCNNREVVLGMDSTVTSINSADSNNVTIKDGCCECGGGNGGPPTVQYKGKTIKKCSDIIDAHGLNEIDGSYLKNACISARVASPESNSFLYREYNSLKNRNENLINTAKQIFNEIKKFKITKKKIGENIDEKDNLLKDQIKEYGDIHNEILLRETDEDKTIEGQLEDIQLKEQSQSLQLLIWSGLAILTILFVIQRMRK
tara:strand:- start:1388 stop:2503 length:1116 start_codon:yes stop_codon:yes gene_type:complete